MRRSEDSRNRVGIEGLELVVGDKMDGRRGSGGISKELDRKVTRLEYLVRHSPPFLH